MDRTRDHQWATPAHFLENIVDAMADPLFVKDEKHRWILGNTAFFELMGRPREEILGKSDFDFFPPSQAEVFWKKDEEVFRSGGVNVNEELLTDADGQIHVLVTKKTVLVDSGGRRILVGTIRDITELKQTQEALRRARDELELRVEQKVREFEESQAHLRQAQKMQAVGQLTGGLAHDFNNLLAVIVGNLEMASDAVDDDGELGELLDLAMSAAARGATLTRRLLAFSRRQALQPRPTDVRALVADMADLLRRTLGRAIAVEIRGDSDVACSSIDHGQLESAILNLAINARDSMPRGGRLAIDTSCIDLSEPYAELARIDPGRYVLVEVTDNGSGMASDTLERVFEPFFTTKEIGEGSGLGLSMVYGFVKQSHGHVTVTSAEHMGTTVKIFLPEHDGPPEELRPTPLDESEPMPIGDGQVVLVVEDEPEVRRRTAMLVGGLGYQVHQAGSAAEALELAATLPAIDLLLSDVVLGGGQSGPELAGRLRTERPELRVLLVSGFATSSLQDGSVDQTYCLLDKPFRREELAHAIRRTLEATAD